jgi:hypothetical protein
MGCTPYSTKSFNSPTVKNYPSPLVPPVSPSNTYNLTPLPPHNIPGLEHVSSEFLAWFVGFVDAEGSFGIRINDGYPTFHLKIALHIDDRPVLDYICKVLGCGTVKNIRDDTQAIFTIGNAKLINGVVIPIFTTFKLQGTKSLDFADFSRAFSIYTITKDVDRVNSIKLGMNTGRTDFSTYPLYPIKLNPYYLLGFIEGDGSFICKGALGFAIGQKYTNIKLIDGIQRYFIAEAIGMGITLP